MAHKTLSSLEQDGTSWKEFKMVIRSVDAMQGAIMLFDNITITSAAEGTGACPTVSQMDTNAKIKWNLFGHYALKSLSSQAKFHKVDHYYVPESLY